MVSSPTAPADGWPLTLPEAEILAHLVHLHHERAREEQAGHVRYLHPAYQTPDH